MNNCTNSFDSIRLLNNTSVPSILSTEIDSEDPNDCSPILYFDVRCIDRFRIVQIKCFSRKVENEAAYSSAMMSQTCVRWSFLILQGKLMRYSRFEDSRIDDKDVIIKRSQHFINYIDEIVYWLRYCMLLFQYCRWTYCKIDLINKLENFSEIVFRLEKLVIKVILQSLLHESDTFVTGKLTFKSNFISSGGRTM